MGSSFSFRLWTICVISCARNRFLSYETHIRKSLKKKVENNLFQFLFTLHKCFVLSFLGIYDFKVVKNIKTEQSLLKNDQSHDVKNNRFFNERVRFNLHCRSNECGIKLQILINNYPRINLVTKGHLRPWYAKHKMSVDESN